MFETGFQPSRVRASDDLGRRFTPPRGWATWTSSGAASQPIKPTAPTILTAPLPPQILPRALATPSLLAHILSDKFCDGLPFHRQECMA